MANRLVLVADCCAGGGVRALRSLIPGMVVSSSTVMRKGLDAFVHFPIDLGNIDLGDGGVDGVDLLKMQPQQKAMVLHDPAAQRLAQSSRAAP